MYYALITATGYFSWLIDKLFPPPFGTRKERLITQYKYYIRVRT